MAKGLVNESSLNSIAEAINVLNGTEGTYMPSEMGEAIIDAIPTETASGNPINITDAAAYPAESVVTTLEPVQEGSGDPSPENVRPITGHTGVELTRTGKNLLPMIAVSQTINGVTFTVNDDGTISVQGTATNNVAFYMFNGTPLASNNYILTVGEITVENGSGGIYASTENTQGGTRLASGVRSGGVNISNAIGCVWLYLQIGATISGTIKPMIRPASDTDPTFEPYTSETHSQTFPQAQSPVYGGEVDWVNGVLRVNKVGHIFDGTENFSIIGGRLSYVVQNVPIKNDSTLNAIGSHYISRTANELWENRDTDGYMGVGASKSGDVGYIFIVDNLNSNKTIETYKAWLTSQYNANTPLVIVYKLATPLETPLTPEVITLLKGENNIWTDSGTSEIEYKVDLQTYIQKLINEASVNASNLSVSPLSLGKSALLTSTDGEDADEIEEVDEPVLYDEVKVSDDVASEDEAEEEPTVKEPDTLEKEDGDTV